jgi:hypothetical protein
MSTQTFRLWGLCSRMWSSRKFSVIPVSTTPSSSEHVAPSYGISVEYTMSVRRVPVPALLAQGRGLEEMAGHVQGHGADQVAHEDQAALHEADHADLPAREGRSPPRRRSRPRARDVLLADQHLGLRHRRRRHRRVSRRTRT